MKRTGKEATITTIMIGGRDGQGEGGKSTVRGEDDRKGNDNYKNLGF